MSESAMHGDMLRECLRLVETLPFDTRTRLASFSKDAFGKQGVSNTMSTEDLAAWEIYWIAKDPKRKALWDDPMLVDAVMRAKDFYMRLVVAEKIGGE